jgi:uridine phosphorylase
VSTCGGMQIDVHGGNPLIANQERKKQGFMNPQVPDTELTIST